ncbi:MAG: OadG family protein [Clostridia bacterium]|nr:OadG family protein [Clostridia bacterium]
MSTAEVVTTGILLVFGLLVLITLVLYILPLVLSIPKRMSRKPKTPAPQSVVQASTSRSDIPEEIVAAIMAAIAAEEEAQGVPYGNFRVVAFKRIGRK